MNPNHNYNNIAINALQIRSCRIDHTNGQAFTYIDNIGDIATQIHAYFDRVECITFFFEDRNIPFHYLILRKLNEPRGRFVVEFFHYYVPSLYRFLVPYSKCNPNYDSPNK